MWNYACLSHTAKQRGGPEAFMNGIYQAGIMAEKRVEVTRLAVVFFMGLRLGAVIHACFNKKNNKIYEAENTTTEVTYVGGLKECEANSK